MILESNKIVKLLQKITKTNILEQILSIEIKKASKILKTAPFIVILEFNTNKLKMMRPIGNKLILSHRLREI